LHGSIKQRAWSLIAYKFSKDSRTTKLEDKRQGAAGAAKKEFHDALKIRVLASSDAAIGR
jgi:hypothetical protein